LLGLPSHGDLLEELARHRVSFAGAELEAGEGLGGLEVIGVDLEGGLVGGDRVVDLAGGFEGEGEVEAWVGVAREKLAGPLELAGGLEELVLLYIYYTEVVVGWAVVEVLGEGLAQQFLGLDRVGTHQGRGLCVEAVGLGGVAIDFCLRVVG
jgi:hypothetical protein